jgi:hypothetical protein
VVTSSNLLLLLLRVLQGPHIHEALHQVAVSELVLDSVGVIWARFLEELLEVVLRQLCLALAILRGLYGLIGAGAALSLVDAIVTVCCGLLAVLFAPLLVGLGTLDSDTGRCSTIADQGWLKLCYLGTDGMTGVEAMSSFSGALGRHQLMRGEVAKMLHHVCNF